MILEQNPAEILFMTPPGLSLCRKAIRLNPKDLLAHFNLARAYREQGRVAQAVAEFKTAIELNPEGKIARDARLIIGEMLNR